MTEPPAFDPCVTQSTGTNTVHQKQWSGVSFEEWSRVSSWHVATRKFVRGAAAPRARSHSWPKKFVAWKRFAVDVGLPRVFPVRHVHSFTDHRRHDGIIMIAREFWKMTRTSCHMILSGAARYSSDGTPTKSHINRNANHTSDLVANQNRIQCSNEEVGSSSFWSTFSAVRAKK